MDRPVQNTGTGCSGERPRLEAERLDVYRVALEFQQLTASFRLGRAARELRDQLDRGSISIVLNIAEGVGRHSPADRARFFGMARGSAAECAAILDILRIRSLAPDGPLNTGRDLLVRIIQMLTRLCQRLDAGTRG